VDLLLVALVAVAMLILAIRRRRRTRDSGHRRPRPGSNGWSFSRHPREDWRYWRDLAVLIGLGLALLLAMVMIAGLQGGATAS